MGELHVVLGAGQVGPLVAQLLVARGHRVRVVRKTAKPVTIPGIDVVSADVRDADAVARATDGATSVYHCVNPLYFEWPALLLPITEGIVEGTRRSGANLVALDNLYMYADTARLHPGSVVAPRSRKGALRAQAAERMLDAAARSGRRVMIGRAADFFGPGATLSAIFGERFFRRVLAGKAGESFGNPDMPHSYSYVPDVAAGLAALGTSTSADGIYMLPVQPAETTRAVIERVYRALGVNLGVARVPTLALRAMGLFNPTVRELVEMIYQWEQPFTVDDSRIRESLGVAPTPWDDAIAATVAWGRFTFAMSAAR
jgi:nucleoside-diphosphate-sugar epimerase